MHALASFVSQCMTSCGVQLPAAVSDMGPILGTEFYGTVDRVPGRCYVTTVFFHICFLPLFPLGTMIVREGSERGSFIRGTVDGIRIPLTLKSVLIGYLRGWSGVTAIVLFTLTGLIVPFDLAVNLRVQADTLMICITALAAMGGAFGTFFVLKLRGLAWIPVQVILHAGSLGVWILCTTNPSLRQPSAKWLSALLVGNLALALFSLTRVFDRAGFKRSQELKKKLGHDTETRSQPPPLIKKFIEEDSEPGSDGIQIKPASTTSVRKKKPAGAAPVRRRPKSEDSDGRSR